MLVLDSRGKEPRKGTREHGDGMERCEAAMQLVPGHHTRAVAAGKVFAKPRASPLMLDCRKRGMIKLKFVSLSRNATRDSRNAFLQTDDPGQKLLVS